MQEGLGSIPGICSTDKTDLEMCCQSGLTALPWDEPVSPWQAEMFQVQGQVPQVGQEATTELIFIAPIFAQLSPLSL